MKRKLIAAVGVAGMVIGLAACGGSDEGKKDGGDKPSAAKELTVWLTVDAQN
ncbi:extracellular solute-binding protein, partial [Streptomyces sp. 12297]